MVPGQVALVAGAEGDALAVAGRAGLVAVHEQGGGGAGGGPGGIAGGDDGQVAPGQPDQGLLAVGFGAGHGEGSEPVDGDQVPAGQLAGELGHLGGGGAAGHAAASPSG